MKNFLAEINERTRSPLIYSFLIAWVIFNWKIPVSLLFEDVKELEAHGYHSHLQFIQAKLNWSNGFFHPFYSALIYTFGFPFVKNIISIFNAWIQRWGNNYSLTASKKGKISTEKYIDLKEAYEKQLISLEQTINNEAAYFKANSALNEEINHLKKDLENLNQIIKNSNEKNDTSVMNGYWSFKFSNESKSSHRRLTSDLSGYFIFENGSVFLSDVGKRKNGLISNIELLSYNKDRGEITFVSIPNKSNNINYIIDREVVYFKLSINPEITTMTGIMGDKTLASFVKH